MSSLFLASDNISASHPHVLRDLAISNCGPAVPYGSDTISVQAKNAITELLGVPQCEIAFVFNGTAANVLGLSSVLERHEAVIAADSSHIWEDEVGAVEHFSGSRIIPVQTQGEKLTVDDLKRVVQQFPRRGSIHRVRPKIVSISQPTEFGRVYTPQEIQKLSAFIHENDMLLHVDGARISNAAVALGSFANALGVSDAVSSCDMCVDILTLGATKNGIMCGEALVFMGRAYGFYNIQLHKQSLNLASKQRFIASQLLTLYGSNLWRENAQKANSSAKKLETIIRKYAKEKAIFHSPVEANAIFVSFPEKETELFLKKCTCYIWDQSQSIIRIMTSWATSDDEISQFELLLQEIFQ